MTKIMASDVVRVSAPYRQRNYMNQSVQRHCLDYSADLSFYGFDSETIDNKFKFRKFNNVIDKFRMEFSVRTKIRTT